MISNEKLRFVDAFAGVGGFHLGIEKALGKDNCECVAFIEWDKDARETYKQNFCVEDSPVELHDITQVKAEDVPAHDILCGGFPCQAFSINKQNSQKSQINTDDERTYLYYDLVRIAEYHKPKYLFFENVANLAKIKKDDGSLMIDDICSKFEKIGYDIEYKVFDAADFGVPQQRKRVYIIGTRKDSKDVVSWPKPTAKSVCVREILEETVSQDLEVDLSSKTCTSRCYHKDDDMSVDWIDSNRYYYNKSNDDPTVYRWEKVNGKKKYYLVRTDLSPNDMVHQNKLEAFEESIQQKENTKDGRYVITPHSIVMYDTPSGLSRQHERIYSVDGLSRTLATFGHPMYNVDGTIRKLSSRESARCQGFPDDFIVNKNHGKACKQFGNAVCVNVIQAIVENNF